MALFLYVHIHKKQNGVCLGLAYIDVESGRVYCASWNLGRILATESCRPGRTPYGSCSNFWGEGIPVPLLYETLIMTRKLCHSFIRGNYRSDSNYSNHPMNTPLFQKKILYESFTPGLVHQAINGISTQIECRTLSLACELFLCIICIWGVVIQDLKNIKNVEGCRNGMPKTMQTKLGMI